MSVRGVATIAAGLVTLTLSACNDAGRSSGKTEASSAERVSELLDVCADSQDEFTRRMCRDRSLATLDSQVRETLVAEAAEVSDAGAELLIQNQARWRDAARVMCGVLDANTAPTPDQLRCLQGQFRARAQQAETAVQEIGGYTFQRMELVDAMATAEIASAATLGEGAPVAVERNIRFPRIDGPQTPAIRRFNELVAQQPQYRLQDATNETVDYTISYAGPELVSVRFVRAAETLGAANVTNTENAVTVLMTEGRPLEAGDVFRAGTGWENFITDRAVAAIAREFSDYPNFPPRRDVYETATKPHLWLIGERGLTLLFPPLSFGGSHVDGGTEVVIPWADLRQYLNPAAPAPIRPSA